jgi:hypothetical protein
MPFLFVLLLLLAPVPAQGSAAPYFLSLKDPPPAPVPSRRPSYHLSIRGFQGKPFEVTWEILQKYHLHNGAVISPILARIIAHDLGYDYSPQLRIILHELDEMEAE